MSMIERQSELNQRSQQLLQGSLKHARAVGLAAALVPLAAVAVTRAEPRACPSGGAVCGVVWNDANQNGIRETGEAPISGAVVTFAGVSTATGADGSYSFSWPGLGTFQVAVQVPPGTHVSPNDAGGDDTVDSDGVSDGVGNSVATVVFSEELFNFPATDFGFWASPTTPAGTGTPGYWQNHPEAWPAEVVVGGRTYSRDEAIGWIKASGKDRTLTMFASLVSAKLNVLNGADATCVASTIDAADDWMVERPVGTNVHAASLAWKLGEPLHRLMDNYNNGMLCAPHRD
jgi:hypothetical protein